VGSIKVATKAPVAKKKMAINRNKLQSLHLWWSNNSKQGSPHILLYHCHQYTESSGVAVGLYVNNY